MLVVSSFKILTRFASDVESTGSTQRRSSVGDRVSVLQSCIAHVPTLTTSPRGQLGTDDLEHIIDRRLHIAQIELLRCESLLHVLLVRRAAERGNAVQLGDPE